MSAAQVTAKSGADGLNRQLVEVAMPLPLDSTFTYALPPGLSYSARLLGARVLAPFGARRLQGFICGPGKSGAAAASGKINIKQIISVLDAEPVFNPDLYKVLRWAADYYHEPLGQVLDTALPQALRRGRPASPIFITKWRLTEQGRQTDTGQLGSKHQRRLLEFLQQQVPAAAAGAQSANYETGAAATVKQQAQSATAENGEWLAGYEASSEALRALKIPAASIASLEKKQLISSETGLKLPVRRFHGVPYVRPTLNAEQQEAVRQISAGLGQFNCFLLEGLTNSGKTEVYIEIIRRVLAQGQQALYLVPEIGLSPQSLERLEKSLGIPLGVSHSSMSAAERLHNYMLMKQGRLKVLVGTRSAAFTPLAKPGCIIMDEEHDGSYKQSSGFRYNAKHLLIKLAAQLRIPIILGSATPSLESFYNLANGKYQHLSLSGKINPAPPPTVTLLPIVGEDKAKVNELPRPALSAIKDTLRAGGQALVFINRRGFSPKLKCADCDWQAVCPSCERSLTLHRLPPCLSCHLCETRAPLPAQCPNCGGAELQPGGLATQSIEQLLRAEFPREKIYRIDRDTMRAKDSLKHFYQQARSSSPCILVGTQILAKGHDFTNVRLGLILNCDAGLFSNDFHNIEQLAQLITQVMGRVGRHRAGAAAANDVAGGTSDAAPSGTASGLPNNPPSGPTNSPPSGPTNSPPSGPTNSPPSSGRILIPTYNPDSTLLHKLVKQGYAAFAKEEMKNRLTYKLPPYSFMAYLRAEAPVSQDALDFLTNIKQQVLAADLDNNGLSQAPTPADPPPHADTGDGHHRAAGRPPADLADQGASIFGPLESGLAKKKGFYSFTLIIKSNRRSQLHRWLTELSAAARQALKPKQKKLLRWHLDVDPLDPP